MKQYTLNLLGMHKNIFIANVDIHTSFDRGKWLFMPEDSILDIYVGGLLSVGKGYKAYQEDFPIIDVCFLLI